ncbi:MAG: DUF3794 domain-containing protein [Butyricicoccus sp.]|nr:DUF3794 domain-containing protein [Butyricicoccus sp.]
MELVRKSIPYYDVILDNVTVYEESADAIVPDTFPDIARIAYADGMVTVGDQSPQNDRILVSGSVAATVLYQPEGETGLRRLDIPLSFAHIEEGRGVGADSVCFVRCSVAAVNARAVNSRKVSVTARLCFETSAYQPETLGYTEQIDSGELPLEVLYDTREISLLRAADTGEFTVLDDLELNSADDLELLHTDCILRQNECRAMNGRLLVRGEGVLRLLLRDDTGSLQQITQTVPFTQMLDVEGLTEGEPVTLRLAVRSVDCVLASGGLLSVGIGAAALVLRDETHTVRTIRDLYQTKHDLQVQAGQAGAHCCALCGGFSADGMETMPVGMRVTQYVCAKAVCTGAQAEDDGTIQLKAEADVVYLDDEGSLYQARRTMSVPVRPNAPLHGAVPQDIALQVTAAPSGEDSVSLRLAVSGQLVRTRQESFQDITSLEVSAEEKPGMGDVTLVLRCVEDGEPLWDIAKQYATTTAAIRAANGLAEDQQTVGAQMLLIPIES